MQKLKSHKTVEQIAKKHRLDVSFIQKQLDMGEPIEHEHTKDHTLAMDIALQHLDEIPDYYTRLKKMEASAKKEHKKFKDVKEDADSGVDDMDSPLHSVHIEYDKRYCTKCKKVELRSKCKYGTRCWDIFSLPEKLKEETMQKEQRYCPLCDKRESRSECSYGGKAWDKVSVRDHEYSMARSELDTLVKAAERIKKKVGKGEGSLEAWVQSKITKAADYIDTAADYIASGEMEESFTINPAAHKVAAKRRKIEALTTSPNPNEADVAKRKLGKTTELPKVKKEEKLVDKILGELQEQDPCWKGYTQVGMKKKAGKPVPNCVPSEGVPKAKGYKKEDVTIEDANGKLYAEVIDLIKPEPMVSPKSTFMANNELGEATRLQSETGNIIVVILSWRGKSYSIRMFFPQVGMPSKKDVTTEIQKVYPGALVLQYNVSTLQAGMPLIQVVNSKSKNYLLNNGTIGEENIEEVAAWQRKEGKNPEGGLNKKGIASYRKEHPGSHLSLAVTTPPSELKPGSKAANRRKSFCARMGGMPGPMKDEKGRPTRKALSLRKWNC